MSKNPERHNRTVYHEAGHAAVAWMFGDAHNIDHINMRGNFGVWGFVRMRPTVYPEMVCALAGTGGDSYQIAKAQAQRACMYNLAGFAAESRIGESSGVGWLEEMLDWDVDWEANKEHDLHRALTMATALYGDNDNARRFLHRMGAWTDEALEHPGLWAATEALAKRLRTVKRRICGNRIVSILDKAWPNGAADLPYMRMGQRWRRRFSLSITSQPARAAKRTTKPRRKRG